MRVTETTGCCAALNFYNVGGAHGHRTANSQEEFEDWLAKKENNDLNYSLTNEDQEQTRKFMKACGWDVYGPYDGIWISVISGSKLQELQSKVYRRQQTERLEKEAARRKAEEERREREKKLKFSPSLASSVFQDSVKAEDIRQLCGGRHPYDIMRGDNRITNTRNAIQDKYKITLPRGWNDRTVNELRQMVYDLVYKARKNAGIL